KTSNASLAPNNTWTCLSYHLLSMSGIGVSNLYVDFSSTPHHIFCVVAIPHSLCIANDRHTIGIYYSLDDGATFNRMDLAVTGGISDLSANPINDMKYWPGNATSTSKYLFVTTQFQILRFDITNPASVTAVTVKDVSSIIPTDAYNERFRGFGEMTFLPSDPTKLFVATYSNNGY